MAQPQPQSLPYWRSRQIEIGADRAVREAAEEIDALLDELGRKRDLMLTALCVSCLWGLMLGAALGFAAAWWRWA